MFFKHFVYFIFPNALLVIYTKFIFFKLNIFVIDISLKFHRMDVANEGEDNEMVNDQEINNGGHENQMGEDGNYALQIADPMMNNQIDQVGNDGEYEDQMEEGGAELANNNEDLEVVNDDENEDNVGEENDQIVNQGEDEEHIREGDTEMANGNQADDIGSDGEDVLVEIEGQRRNTSKYYHNGFFYHKEGRIQRHPYQDYRCVLKRTRRCSGMIKFNTVTRRIERQIEHSVNGADVSSRQLEELKLNLKQEAYAARGYRSLRNIFDHICLRYVLSKSE